MQHHPSGNDIDRRAADWAAAVELRPLDPNEEAELQGWLDADSRHLGAYGRARAMLVRCDRVSALGPDFPDLSAIDNSERRSWMPSRRWFIGGASAGLGAAAAGVAGVMLWPRSEISRSIGTTRGEISMVPLGEGSVATLNTGTRIALDFSRSERRVHLIGGEVFFDVAHSEVRPFIVQARGYSARALGSRFSLRSEPGLLEILVADGALELLRPAPDAQLGHLRLAANMKLVDRADRLSWPIAVTAEDIAHELAWREGQIAFDERTLADAAAEYRRYSAIALMPDPDVASLRISGLFSTANPVGFADAAANVLGIRARQTAQGIRLSRV
jgi:transmembrane sensor